MIFTSICEIFIAEINRVTGPYLTAQASQTPSNSKKKTGPVILQQKVLQPSLRFGLNSSEQLVVDPLGPSRHLPLQLHGIPVPLTLPSSSLQLLTPFSLTEISAVQMTTTNSSNRNNR
jgi:hypothetical protein